MRFIRFDKDVIDINYTLKFGVTNRAYEDFTKEGKDPQVLIKAFSKLSQIIAIPPSEREKEGFFWLNSSLGRFRCTSNKDQDGLSIVSYRENDLLSQNRALVYGRIFALNKGIIIEGTEPIQGGRYRFLNGKKYDAYDLKGSITRPAMDIIVSAMVIGKESIDIDDYLISKTVKDPEEEIKDQRISALLKQAEEYAILESELEEKKIHELGKVSYKSFHASDLERIDRLAYSFEVDSIDKTVFREGAQIEIEGRFGKMHGEIADISEESSERIELTVLFNKQVSISSLLPFGWISLSYSTVNKDVQLEANRRILDRTAKSQYMVDVFGGNETKGFENNNLETTIAKLRQRKYPPNDSQITAIKNGINSKDVYLVMGPPGTGKTTVILEWVKYFVEVEHKRVLVSSQNNKAVDNVLARLTEEENIDIIRIGSELKLQQEVLPYIFENKISSLNKTISCRTETVIGVLKKSIAEWEEYRKKYDSLKRVLSATDSIEELTKENINLQLIPIKRKQKDLHTEYNKALSKLNHLIQDKNKCDNVIRAYKSKGHIGRLLLQKSYKEANETLKKIESVIGETESEIGQIVAKYKKYTRIYDIQKSVILDKYIHDMENEKKNALKLNEITSTGIPKPPGIVGLFECVTCEPKHIQSVVGLRVYLKKIDSEIHRAQRILKCEEEWKGNIVNKQNYSLGNIVLESVDIVGATCIGVNSQRRFADLDFDITIIDEAGQIQIHNALVPMSVSNKLIMLGDHKQIPPSADKEMVELCEMNGVETDLLKKSLFEKMFTELPEANKMMLDTQYRMPGDIADTISEWFYEGRYKSPSFKYGVDGILTGISSKPMIIIDTAKEKNRFEKRTEEHGTYNVLEAKLCGEIIDYVVKKTEIELKDIGIISAYKDQVSLIKKEVSKIIPEERTSEIAATLDSFQGQERDLIIYSFTKSSQKKPEQMRIGFLNELRRLNVAITRCKKTIVLIGDMKFLSECKHQNIDDDGNTVYEQSEKQFSDFMIKLLRDADSGRGLRISCQELRYRIAE